MSPTKCLLLLLIAVVSSCQRFDFPLSPSRSPGLQVDGTGRVYTSAGSRLYRLNGKFRLEETRNLTSEAVNISLSSDGRWLVVCLTDLSCEVYNATNFSAGHIFRRGTSLVPRPFSRVGRGLGTRLVPTMTQQKISLGQFRFGGSSANSYYDMINTSGFVRNFYGSGFV